MWEVAIKSSLGKMSEFNGGVSSFIEKVQILPVDVISIYPYHIEVVEALPFIHRDPFDRLLVATAMAEDMTILTADENICKYDIKSIW